MSTPVKKKRGVGLGLSITRSLSMTSNATRLLPYLVLGGQEVVSDSAMLELFSVTHVLNASTEISCAFEDRLSYLRVPVEDKPEADVKQHFGAIRTFLSDVKERHQRGEKCCCFVHCKTGMSRSTTSVLAFLISEPGMMREVAAFTSRSHLPSAAAAAAASGESAKVAASAAAASSVPVTAEAAEDSELDGESSPFMRLRDALAYVRERRPRASPNQGFMAQLLELEASLHSDGVSIDIAKYSADRFGDVRACCIGSVHPAVGYTGGAATVGFSAAEDAMLLQTQVQAVVEPASGADASVAPAAVPVGTSASTIKSFASGPGDANGDSRRPARVDTQAGSAVAAAGSEPASSGSASSAAFAGFAGAETPSAPASTESSSALNEQPRLDHQNVGGGVADHAGEHTSVGIAGSGAAATVPRSKDDQLGSNAAPSGLLPVAGFDGDGKARASATARPFDLDPQLKAQAASFSAGPGLATGMHSGLGTVPLLASLPASFAGGSLMLRFGSAGGLQPVDHASESRQHLEGEASGMMGRPAFKLAASSATGSVQRTGPRSRSRSRSSSQARSATAAAPGAVQARRSSISASHGQGTGTSPVPSSFATPGSGKLTSALGERDRHDHRDDAAAAQALSPGSGSLPSPISYGGAGSGSGGGYPILSTSGSRATTALSGLAVGPVGFGAGSRAVMPVSDSRGDSLSPPVLCVHGVGSPQRRSSVSSSSMYRSGTMTAQGQGRSALASPGSLVASGFSSTITAALSPASGLEPSGGTDASGLLAVTGSAVPLLPQQKPPSAGPVGVVLVPPSGAVARK